MNLFGQNTKEMKKILALYMQLDYNECASKIPQKIILNWRNHHAEKETCSCPGHGDGG